MSTTALDPSFRSQPIGRASRWLEAGAVLVALALAALIVLRPDAETANVAIVTIAVAALAGWIAAQDVKTYTIADGATAAMAVLALAYRWTAGDGALVLAADCLLTGGVLFVFREIYYRHRGFDGLGLGDVKLAAAGGLLVGAVAFAWVLLAASFAGLILVAGSGRIGAPIDRSKRLAFGAALAPALWLAWLVEVLPILLSAGS